MTEICQRCGEPIDGHRADNASPFHPECLFRSVMGSIAHLRKTCACFVPGSTEGDPEGMTKRGAAMAAYVYFNLHR